MVILIFSCAKKETYSLPMTNQQNTANTFLALGDSYTIGHNVPSNDNFPNQTVQLLKNHGYNFKAAEIVATTGWTTDELQNNINNRTLLHLMILSLY